MAEFYEEVNEYLGLEDEAYGSNEDIMADLEEKRDELRKKSISWSGVSIWSLATAGGLATYGVETAGEVGVLGAAVGGAVALTSGVKAYVHKNKMESTEEQRREVGYGAEENMDVEAVASLLEPKK